MLIKIKHSHGHGFLSLNKMVSAALQLCLLLCKAVLSCIDSDQYQEKIKYLFSSTPQVG